ncbi:MAG: 50S ribosomal protein L3 [Candidatus Micrarchaeia archaeon]|jgi:large subunit ribosomal protein L3
MRRGSLEFWPHRRAKRQLPRVRSWPKVAEPLLLGLVAYKVGMTHVGMIDDTESPSKGSEVVRAATILEIPKIYLYGMRFYKKEGYKEPALEIYSKELASKVGIKNAKNTPEKLADIKKNLSNYVDVTALMFADPSTLGFGKKKISRFEVPVGGDSIEKKIELLEKYLGKEVKAKEILKNGEFVDVTSITKGKGWAGVIKRFGVARQMRKATGKVRHVGTLGPWHPPKVLYTVPHAGHMGYNYRTELNKRILKIGSAEEAKNINVKGGFLNYGIVKNDFIIVDGSLPGPAKRLVRIRKALRSKVKEPQEVKLTFISTSSKQGA